MKWITAINRLTPLLAILCVVMAGVVAVEWRALTQPPPSAALVTEMPKDTPAIAQPQVAFFLPPAIETFSEILDRPLFTEGRQPPPEPEVEVAKPVEKQVPLQLALEGVAITPEERIAVVRDLRTKKLLRLAEGSKHQGWELESVHASGVTLRRGEQTRDLELEINQPKSGAPRVGRTFAPYAGLRSKSSPPSSQQSPVTTGPATKPGTARQKPRVTSPSDKRQAQSSATGNAAGKDNSQPGKEKLLEILQQQKGLDEKTVNSMLKGDMQEESANTSGGPSSTTDASAGASGETTSKSK